MIPGAQESRVCLKKRGRLQAAVGKEGGNGEERTGGMPLESRSGRWAESELGPTTGEERAKAMAAGRAARVRDRSMVDL